MTGDEELTTKSWVELPTKARSKAQRCDVLRNWVLGSGLLESVPHAVLEMYRHIPKSELAVLPGADHYLVWSRPEMFSSIVLDFLQRSK